MLKMNPYLNFMGNTEDAFNFYKSVFGGEFGAIMRFKDTPEKDRVPVHEQDKLMHIALPVGSGMLMGTDALESMGHVVSTGTNMSISIDADSEEEAKKTFDALSDSAKVSVPLEKMFWGAWFGMLTDKFGIQWMVTYNEQMK